MSGNVVESDEEDGGEEDAEELLDRTPAAAGGLFRTGDGREHAGAFMLVASLFALWGFANGLIDVMDKHFQDVLHLSKANSAWVQFAHWMGYFCVSIPAGLFARRFGYRAGIVAGLSLVSLAGFWFVPATWIGSFWPFLLGVLVLAAGLTFLETVANPYTLLLGSPALAVARINIAQSFNGVGLMLGPLVGSLFFYTPIDQDAPASLYALWNVSSVAEGQACLANLTLSQQSSSAEPSDAGLLFVPYLGIAVLVLCLIVIFLCAKLPEFPQQATDIHSLEHPRDIPHQQENQQQENQFDNQQQIQIGESLPPPFWKRPHFLLGVAAQFAYVGAQTCVFAFFINYMVSDAPRVPETLARMLGGSVQRVCGAYVFTAAGAAKLQSGAFSLFFLGRVLGSALLLRARADLVTGVWALCGAVAMLLVVARWAWLSVAGLFLSFFFMSILFPTIFALAIFDLGPHKELASAFVVMAILGGALLPKLMGAIADHANVSASFSVPFVCLLVISAYGFLWPRLSSTSLHHPSSSIHTT